MTKQTVLVIQCCHRPQFFYVVEKLRRRYPEWELEALVYDHPQIRYHLEMFPHFRKVHFLGKDLSELSKVDRIVFPLLNRGYWKIKKAAQALSLPCWEVDYEGNLNPLETKRSYLSLLSVLHSPAEDFSGWVREFPLQPLGKRILLLESCHPSLLDKVEGQLGCLIPQEAEIVHVQKGSPMQMWVQARRKSPDSAVVFFSGEKGFAVMKLVAFLLALPRILVVDENGHFFYAGVRSLCRFSVSRILYGVSSPKPRPRILLVQTETPLHVSHVIGKLKEKKFFPQSKIILLCRQEDRPQLESNSHVDQILTYSRQHPLNNLRLWKEIKSLDPDMTCAIFSGRPYFRKAKLLFFFLPIRRHLVFNAKLDCYDLSPRTFFWIFRKEPLFLESEADAQEQRVLLLQTDHHLETIKVIAAIMDKRVVPKARLSVFCAQDYRNVFESRPEVEKVFTYDRQKLAKSAQTVWTMARFRADIVAAIFSRRPIFLKQKLLFFMLPARHRLVFNENLDCFYLSWQNCHRLFSRNFESMGVLEAFFRKIVKVLLFVPRFAYLLMWAMVMKWKRIASKGGR